MTLAKINYSGYILSGKEYFRIRNITKNKERHYITVMGWVYKEGIKNGNVTIYLIISFLIDYRERCTVVSRSF